MIPKPDDKNYLKGYAKYSSMAIQMAVIIIIGVFGGHNLDVLIQWKFPVFTVVLSIFSVFGAIYLTVKDLLKNK
jgi:hypothetical protein